MIIVTGDRDILQLVNTKIGVFLPAKGLSEGKVHNSQDVVEKMGVAPGQIVDYKALVGDQSDNYPGVPGIGPKTAIDLLGEYKTFENIYRHMDDIKESVRKKLTSGRKSGEMSLMLAKIITTVPFEFNTADFSKWKVDGVEVLNLFAEFGFRTLTRRVKEVGEKFNKEKQMELI